MPVPIAVMPPPDGAILEPRYYGSWHSIDLDLLAVALHTLGREIPDRPQLDFNGLYYVIRVQ